MNGNQNRIEALRERYIRLWRQGHTVDVLKRRTRQDFAHMGITGEDLDSFAEWTIYRYVKCLYRPSSQQ